MRSWENQVEAMRCPHPRSHRHMSLISPVLRPSCCTLRPCLGHLLQTFGEEDPCLIHARIFEGQKLLLETPMADGSWATDTARLA